MLSRTSSRMSIGSLLDEIGVQPPVGSVSDPGFKHDVQNGFRRWALRNHPDKGGNPEVFQRVSSANDQVQEGSLHPSFATLKKWQGRKTGNAPAASFAQAPRFTAAPPTPSTSNSADKDRAGKATQEIINGANVQNTAKKYGIATPDSIREMERIAINSDRSFTAGSDLRNGANVQNTAKKYGIATPDSIREMERIAASVHG